jgi:hypothetical protein
LSRRPKRSHAATATPPASAPFPPVLFCPVSSPIRPSPEVQRHHPPPRFPPPPPAGDPRPCGQKRRVHDGAATLVPGPASLGRRRDRDVLPFLPALREQRLIDYRAH